ncbi:FUSC family protein [Paraburkholderia caribensis]|uniref:FUSC family protein n=1 Tax=Paraburkholderia caribensis TaxID=75105 RepID=UPI001CB06E53|nr:FUSC family protein [Paraburkholderia caribensis]CAG9246343.1 putative multidrug efflux pump subunit MdtO [Paraburkholderia caribensis]
MNLADYMPERLRALASFFREELTEARPGRAAQATQLGALCLLVVLVSMTLRVPMIAVSLIVLFYGVQPNAFFTKVVAFVFVVATVLDVGCLFLVLKYAYGYPLIRIAAAGLILLGSMYLMRVNKLGLMFFAVALVAAYGQTIPDSLDFPEIAVRALMWAVVAGMYPVLLMVIVCGYLIPSRPVALLQRELHRQLSDVSARLDQMHGAPIDAPVASPAARIEKDTLALQGLHTFAISDDAAYRALAPYWNACIAAVGYLRATANALAARRLPMGDAGRALVSRLKDEVSALNASVEQAVPYRGRWIPTRAERATAMTFGLDGVCQTLQALAHFDLGQPVPKAPKDALFVPDSLTNPAYLRFALKVALAASICYVFYHGAQWDGIHTSLLTCVIVAYPSTGASFQKMMLRCGGALIGALLALLTTVVIIPRLDGIFGFLLMLAPIFFAGAWVATGSERSSYIGTQFVFTFAMATLESGFGPSTDLGEIRDRAIGILIGIVVSAVVYTFIWPESEANTLRQKLADALREAGKLIRHAECAGRSEQLGYLQQRVACWTALKNCEDMAGRVTLEVNLRAGTRQATLQRARNVLEGCRQILDQWDVLRDSLRTEGHEQSDQAWDAWRQQAAETLDDYADRLAAQPPTAAPPRLPSIAPSANASPALAAQSRQLAMQIIELPDWTPVASGIDTAAEQPGKSI